MLFSSALLRALCVKAGLSSVAALPCCVNCRFQDHCRQCDSFSDLGTTRPLIRQFGAPK